MVTNYFPPSKTNLLVIYDLLESSSKSNEVEKAFTKYTHTVISRFFIWFRISSFEARRVERSNWTPTTCCFLKTLEKLQLSVLAPQIKRGNSKYFLECFLDLAAIYLLTWKHRHQKNSIKKILLCMLRRNVENVCSLKHLSCWNHYTCLQTEGEMIFRVMH